jgi:6-phosphogluconolactonase/glucosamine-6-phosphate isomerase/deaminase
VLVTVMGEEKHDALRRVVEGDPDAPGTHVHADKVVWLADAAAAKGLG